MTRTLFGTSHPRSAPPDPNVICAIFVVERVWHMSDSQGQIMQEQRRRWGLDGHPDSGAPPKDPGAQCWGCTAPEMRTAGEKRDVPGVCVGRRLGVNLTPPTRRRR